MKITVELPQVGESVVEGILARWLKRPGEPVQSYEPLAEIVTDKVTMELPSPVSGTILRFLVEEGAKVPVGTPLLEIETEEAHEAPAAPAPSTPPEDRVETAVVPSERVGRLVDDIRPVGPTGGGLVEEVPAEASGTDASEPALAVREVTRPAEPKRPWYSPAVRRLAREHGIDLTRIPGSGVGGRVTKEDVLAFLSRQEAEDHEQRVPASPIRRLIAENMQRSVREIPQAWAMVEVDVTGLVRYRERIKEEFQKREGVKLTYLPFVLQAVIEALKRHPLLNARWEEGEIVLRRRLHIGIAVATENGLVVPVIRDADRLSLAGLARAAHELAERARQNRLTLEDVRGGTFTVNNTGALGTVLSRPIVPPDQAGILTTETITRRLVVSDDGIGAHGRLTSLDIPLTLSVRFLMNICLSFDHRILDGAEAAAFLQTVKRHLEAIAP